MAALASAHLADAVSALSFFCHQLVCVCVVNMCVISHMHLTASVVFQSGPHTECNSTLINMLSQYFSIGFMTL